MLGVRLYKNIQIDLWCGEIKDFVSDGTLQLNHHTTPKKLSEFLQQAKPRSHVSLHCENDGDCRAGFFAELKQILDTVSQHHLPRRLTMITPNLEVYRNLQEQLFATFSED